MNKALLFATKAHAGQRDNAGEPYIYHVVQVLVGLNCDLPDLDYQSLHDAAALHDVLEDSAMTEQDLEAAGFSEPVVQAVVALTRQDGEAYDDYITRVCQNKLALVVKQSDLHHNLDRFRIRNPTQRDQKRWERYERALVRINAALAEAYP